MKCITCKIKKAKNKFCSKQCYWESLEGIKGDKAPIHKWLNTNYGRPRICEDKKCDGKIENRWFDWALKKGCKYKRNRNNFLRLCRSCHRRYDMTLELKKKAIKNLHWVTKKVRISKYGKKFKEKHILD